MAEPLEVRRTELETKSWLVLRTGRLEEVETADGRVRYRVKIWDAGRDAFITTNFNDEGPAQDFLDRVQEENSQYVREWEKLKNAARSKTRG